MRLRTSASGNSGGISGGQVRHHASTTRSAGCETTIVCGRYRRNQCCPRDEGQTSSSAKQRAFGSRADSDRMFTICYAASQNSLRAPLTRSCPNTFRRRSIRTSWTPCASRQGHLPTDSTNPCPEEAGGSGSTLRGMPGSGSVSLRRTTNVAPCASTTSGSATACWDWRPRTSGGIPTMAGTWCRMVWRCAVCIIRRWILGRWGWRGRGVGFGFWCPGGCGGGVRLRGGWWGCGGGRFGCRVARRTRPIGGLWSGIGWRCIGGEGWVTRASQGSLACCITLTSATYICAYCRDDTVFPNRTLLPRGQIVDVRSPSAELLPFPERGTIPSVPLRS